MLINTKTIFKTVCIALVIVVVVATAICLDVPVISFSFIDITLVPLLICVALYELLFFIHKS